MKNLFVVSIEAPANAELTMVVFTSKMKAIRKFESLWESLMSRNVRKECVITVLKDEDTSKDYYLFDGSCGFTVKLLKVNVGEEFSAF